MENVYWTIIVIKYIYFDLNKETLEADNLMSLQRHFSTKKHPISNPSSL